MASSGTASATAGHERERGDRGELAFRLRALAKIGDSRLARLAELRGARLGGFERVGREPAAQRLREIGQGGLRITLDGHLGGIVLADLPRVEIHVNEGKAFRHGLDVGRQGEGEDVAAHAEEQIMLHEEGADGRAEAREGPAYSGCVKGKEQVEGTHSA